MRNTATRDWAHTWLVALLLVAVALGPHRAHAAQLAEQPPVAEAEVAPGLLPAYGDTSPADRAAQTRRRALIHDAIAADPRLRHRNRLGQRLILTGCLVGGVATGVLFGSALMMSWKSDLSGDPRDEVAAIALGAGAGFTFLSGVAILSAGIALKANAKREARIDVGLAVTDSSGGVQVGGRF